MLSKLVSGPRKKKSGTVPVHLNVYDLTPINGYAYWLGLGVYHSGVQVHGVEYGFGAHEHETTGIFEVQPKNCPGFTFRKSILIGTTDLGPSEVREFMEKLAQEYSGNTYHLISKNCNHFCADVCLKLTGKSIPRWVNRLARLGLLCNCVLPTGLNDAKVSQVTSESVQEGEKKKVRSQSSRYEASSDPALSSRPRSSAIKSSSQRYCRPSPSSVINASSTSTLTVK
ncbi:deSI-like protein At4g17486 [Lotus japonicus]|uniref:deSI-like protein At4g17486 n=1 Tax=Lotus japonicus TaxID=34305 RepID=UPI002582901B|nr:deSI-like protein At4g17486 [Lotus japonicus]